MGRARAVIAVVGFATVVAVVPPLAGAATRAALPQVGVVARAGAVTISGDAALKQGPTMIHFSGANKSGKEIDLTLSALKPCASEKQLFAEAAILQGPPTPLQMRPFPTVLPSSRFEILARLDRWSWVGTRSCVRSTGCSRRHGVGAPASS